MINSSFQDSGAIKSAAWCSLSPALLLIGTLIYFDVSLYLVGLVAITVSLFIGVNLYSMHRRFSQQFRSLSNLLEAMVRGDYSMRAKNTVANSAFGELTQSINRLAARLSDQRREAVESQLLLSTVMNNIDIGIVTFDTNGSITFTNPAIERLFPMEAQGDSSRLESFLAEASKLALGIDHILVLERDNIDQRFSVHVSTFIDQGHLQTLLLISAADKMLRNEERKAWKNLVRVISHEINNSLVPIASLSQALLKIEPSAESRDDIQAGLATISRRAINLKGFIQEYGKLTQVPVIQPKLVDMGVFCQQLIELYPSIEFDVSVESSTVIHADPGRLEQVFINLIQNASEAVIDDQSLRISISVESKADATLIHLSDNGPGVANIHDVFIPLYSTKPNGSGIGLALSREIIEAHQGQLFLQNINPSGCRATIQLPVNPS